MPVPKRANVDGSGVDAAAGVSDPDVAIAPMSDFASIKTVGMSNVGLQASTREHTADPV
jgi:hypothetical protein